MELFRGKALSLAGSGKEAPWLIGQIIELDERFFMLVSENLAPERPSLNRVSFRIELHKEGLDKNAMKAAELAWTRALEKYEDNFPAWVELSPETVTRCADTHDRNGVVIFEGDVIENAAGVKFLIRFGDFQSNGMTHYGFYRWVVGSSAKEIGWNTKLPLGEPDKEAKVIGNLIDNPEYTPALMPFS